MFDSDRAFITQQLRKDTVFLRDLGIMDYSLLLCIEKRNAMALNALRPSKTSKKTNSSSPKTSSMKDATATT